MPNSGTVSAGSVALASQYNNLRADVLSNTTGHVHDGTTDGGKQIEGTVLKSTGATSGYVLTAGAGGTATTWTAPAPGASISYATASFVWGSQSTLATTQYVGATTTDRQIAAVTGQGTVMAMVGNVAGTARAVRTFNLNLTATAAGSVAAIASVTIQPAVAGTVALGNFLPLPTHLSTNNASTAVYFLEKVDATTSGNDTVTLRKYSRDLTSNIWNATLVNNITNFNDWSGEATVYAPEADCFVGFTGPTITAAFGTIFAVNATSGSVFSTVFGTGTFVSGTNSIRPIFALYVPGVSGADGTVHAWGTGVVGGTASSAHAAWSLNGSTGFTFVSQDTTNYFYRFANTASNTWVQIRPRNGYWDNAGSCIVLTSNAILNNNTPMVIGYDRSLTNVLFWNHGAYQSQMNTGLAIGDSNHPWRTTSATGGGNVFLTGAPGDYYFPQVPAGGAAAGYTSPAGVNGFAGVGSVTHIVFSNTAGSVAVQPAYATLRLSDPATIAGTSTKSRLISMSPVITDFDVMQVTAKDSYLYTDAMGVLQNFTANTNTYARFPMLVADSGTVGMRLQSQDGTFTSGTVLVPVRVINIG